MRLLLPLFIGMALWSLAGWMAHPRELWDVTAFWPVWGVATVAAGALGLTRAARPLRDTALVFLPILGVLTISTLLSDRDAGLLPLGLAAVAVLALPGFLAATLAGHLKTRRQ
jgi:hypothetical protein